MPRSNKDFENLSRAKPLLRTVSNLRNATNNIRMFTDSFEQLLNSLESFAPTIEAAAKGKDVLVSKLALPRRPAPRPPEATTIKKDTLPEDVDREDLIE